MKFPRRDQHSTVSTGEGLHSTVSTVGVWSPSLLQKQEELQLIFLLCSSVKSSPTEQTTPALCTHTVPSPATSLPVCTLSLMEYPVLPMHYLPVQPMTALHSHHSQTGGVNAEHIPVTASLIRPPAGASSWYHTLSPTPSPPSFPGSTSSTPQN